MSSDHRQRLIAQILTTSLGKAEELTRTLTNEPRGRGSLQEARAYMHVLSARHLARRGRDRIAYTIKIQSGVPLWINVKVTAAVDRFEQCLLRKMHFLPFVLRSGGRKPVKERSRSGRPLDWAFFFFFSRCFACPNSVRHRCVEAGEHARRRVADKACRAPLSRMLPFRSTAFWVFLGSRCEKRL